MNELLLGGLAIGGGLLTGGLLYLAFRPRRDRVVALEIVSEETLVRAPARAREGDRATPFEDAPFSLVQPSPAGGRRVPVRTNATSVPDHDPLRILDNGALRPTYDPDDPPELPDSPIPTEWARRQVGPLDNGRMKGLCSGCGTHLSISQERPVRIACPVCGRTRLLAA